MSGLCHNVSGLPGGGYHKFEVVPWVLLGITGVVRGDFRNATIVAEKPVDVIIIAEQTYLEHWHATYTSKELDLVAKKLKMPGHTQGD